MRRSKAQQAREWRAIKIALVTALMAAITIAGMTMRWQHRGPWLPVATGLTVGVIAYAIIAPEL